MPLIPEVSSQQRSYLPIISSNNSHQNSLYYNSLPPVKSKTSPLEQIQEQPINFGRNQLQILQSQSRGFEQSVGMPKGNSPPPFVNYGSIRFSSEPLNNVGTFNANVPKFNQGQFNTFNPPEVSQRYIEDHLRMSNRIRITKYKNN